jgi:hypothetical protein
MAWLNCLEENMLNEIELQKNAIERALAANDVKSEWSRYKLNPLKMKGLTPNEIDLFLIIREETEAERERLRKKAISQKNKQAQGVVDYVDFLHWDELFDEELVYLRIANRAKLPVTDVVQFVCQKCAPENWRALLRLWEYEHEKKQSHAWQETWRIGSF